MDKTEVAGESAWTKLLSEDNSKAPVLIKSSNIKDGKQTAALHVEQLSINALPASASADPVADSSANIEQAYNRSATYGSGINSAGGESSGSGTLLSRKESFLGSFHKQIRRSIKAVSESPGALNR